MDVLQGGVVSTSPNPQAGGPPIVGCPRLLIQFIRRYPPYRRPFLYPQPEDAPCRGDRDPLHGIYSVNKPKYICYILLKNAIYLLHSVTKPQYICYILLPNLNISATFSYQTAIYSYLLHSVTKPNLFDTFC